MSEYEKIDRYTIDIEKRIENTDTEIVYEEIITWLIEKKAKVKKENRPRVIKADHGSSWKGRSEHIDSKKNLEFILTQDGFDTILRIVIDPPWHSRGFFHVNEARRNWLRFIEDLLVKLGVETEVELKQELYDPMQLKLEEQRADKNKWIGLIVVFMGFAWSLYELSQYDHSSFGTYIATGGILAAIYSWFQAQTARKRFRQLSPEVIHEYHDTVGESKGDPNRGYKIVLVIVFIATIGGVYWIWSRPDYTTYSKFGFSLEYPRGMSVTERQLGGVPFSEIAGEVFFSSDDHAFAVQWITYERSFTVNASEYLDGFVESFDNQFDELEVGERMTTSINNCLVRYQEFIGTTQGGSLKAIVGTWDSTAQNRLYALMYISETFDENDEFFICLNSFQFS